MKDWKWASERGWLELTCEELIITGYKRFYVTYDCVQIGFHEFFLCTALLGVKGMDS